jgi:hypothetical protein
MPDESSANHEIDEEFRSQLERRILSYSHQEQRLAVQLRELADELHAVKRRRQSAEDLYRAEFGDVTDDLRVAEAPGEYRPGRPTGPLTGIAWSQAISRVLEEAGGPLHVREIWQRLAAGGFRSDAADPVRSVVAIAVRNAGIMKVRPNTYALSVRDAANAASPGGNNGAGGESRS